MFENNGVWGHKKSIKTIHALDEEGRGHEDDLKPNFFIVQ